MTPATRPVQPVTKCDRTSVRLGSVSRDVKPPPNVALRDFADLKRALKQAAREAAARLEQERAEQARRQSQVHDAALFRQAVGSVHPLPDAGRRAPEPARKAQPVPAHRQADEQAVLQESLSDEFDVESLLETDDTLSWRRPELGVDVVRKLRRGVWALQGALDLHGLRVDEAREALGQFIRQSHRNGLRCVRVVHGKGLGILAKKVPNWLIQHPNVRAFHTAPKSWGKHGALLLLLKLND